jgi:hypothetical protein
MCNPCLDHLCYLCLDTAQEPRPTKNELVRTAQVPLGQLKSLWDSAAQEKPLAFRGDRLSCERRETTPRH